MDKTKSCAECQKEFTYYFNEEAGYPDKRKYCDECKEIKAKAWEARQNGQASQPTMEKGQAKEFHLTDEAINSNALRCAIEIKKANMDDIPKEYQVGVIELAKQLKTFITTGN